MSAEGSTPGPDRPPSPGLLVRIFRRLFPGPLGAEAAAELERQRGEIAERRGRALAALWHAAHLGLPSTWSLAWRLRRGRGVAGKRTVGASLLDLKLALRILARQPGLAVVAGLGIAVALAIGATGFGAYRMVTASDLPLPDGDRIVTLQYTSGGGLDQMRHLHLHDLQPWRAELTAVQDVGAYRIITRNLVADGVTEPARVVEMSAAGFRVARTPPLLGRTLDEGDERPGAEPVAVIGHGVWQDRFGSDPEVLGRRLRIGDRTHTIVGVMPPGFAFPINNRVWTPFRLDPLDWERGEAPPIDVFGRLAPGATIEQAQSQIETLGARAAADAPEVFQNVRARVFPYAHEGFWGPLGWFLAVAELAVSAILLVIAVNVAVLMYAYTASRRGELAVRAALGAGRRRIVRQLFTEAFVLALVGAAVGLAAAWWFLTRVGGMVITGMGEQAPFWWEPGLPPESVLYAVGMAAAIAVVIGVVPALRVTGRGLESGLRSAGSTGGAPRLGKAWTLLLALQVVAAVAVLPVTINFVTAWVQLSSRGTTGEGLDVVSGQLTLDPPSDAVPGATATDPATTGPGDEEARYAALVDEVERRIARSPGVVRVMRAAPPPWADPDYPTQVQGGAPRPATAPAGATDQAGWSRVEPDWFDAFGLRPHQGRLLEARDVADGGVVVVSRGFVERVLAGGEALGRRIRPGRSVADYRYPAGPDDPWYTIVGVVADPADDGIGLPEPKVYAPLMESNAEPLHLVVRTRDVDPRTLPARMRSIAAEVDPLLRFGGLESLVERRERSLAESSVAVRVLIGVTLSVVLLSLAGLYALMKFTITRRRREIGIRSALGGEPRRVLAGVIAQAARPLAGGVVVGLVLAWLADVGTHGNLLTDRAWVLLPAVAALMGIAGLLAAIGPAREGLKVEPTEALRAE